jgi:hypothetical protein
MEQDSQKGAIDRFFDRLTQAGKKDTPAFDRAVEISTESSLFLIGLAKALELSQDPFYTIGITQHETIADTPRLSETIAGEIGGIAESTQRLAWAFTALSESWTDAYRKSDTESYTVTSCDDDGCSTSRRSRIVTYWKEPTEYTELGLTHDAINNWKDIFHSISNSLQYLQARYEQAPSFTSEESPYELTLDQIQANNPDMLRLIGFGGAVTVYALYEDILGKLLDSNALRFDNIKRRSFLKIVGLWGALNVVEKIRLSSLTDNQQAFKSSQDYIHEILGTTTHDPNEVFQLYMGHTVSGEEEFLGNIQQVIGHVLSRDTTHAEDYQIIHPKLEELRVLLSNHVRERSYVFEQGILSETLGHAMRSVYIDDAVRYFVGERNFIGYTAGLAQVGVLAATLVGASVGVESIIAVLNNLNKDKQAN